MHERSKVSEAEFFLALMEERSNSGNEFQHCLSAFLSAARSALQYALEEAKIQRCQQWYENAMTASPVLRFFKDKRDINIHEKPLLLMQQVTLTETVHVSISESVQIKIKKEDGTTEIREFSSARTPTVTQHSESRVETQYVFDDWQGTEDVLTLSKTYLGELKSFVEAGIRSGNISG